MAVTMRPLGRTGLQVSEIGFGALEIGRDWAADVNADPSHPTEQEAARVLNGLLDLGVNFIDTAPAYWSSEEFVGNALAHRRDEFILATKVGEHCDRSGSVYDYSRAATLAFIDRSLARVRTDRIDLLQIHSASMEVLERGETLEAMQEAQTAGKVLHLGMTGGVNECVRAIEMGGYETVQAPYNLLMLEAEEVLLPLARAKGVGRDIMRGIAGGKLTAKHTAPPKDERLRAAIAGFERFVGGADGARDLVHLAIAYLLATRQVPPSSSARAASRRLWRISKLRTRRCRPHYLPACTTTRRASELRVGERAALPVVPANIAATAPRSTFVKETRITATPEEVWAFHERPDALKLLTPPFDRIRIVRPPASLAAGTEVVLKTRIGPFWKTIVAVHTASRRPEFFEDIMRRGPFAHWRHRHLFLPDPGGTLLRDEIEYLPPLGWLGRLGTRG